MGEYLGASLAPSRNYCQGCRLARSPLSPSPKGGEGDGESGGGLGEVSGVRVPDGLERCSNPNAGATGRSIGKPKATAKTAAGEAVILIGLEACESRGGQMPWPAGNRQVAQQFRHPHLRRRTLPEHQARQQACALSVDQVDERQARND